MANDCSKILEQIQDRIDESGDLPIFSATVNRIRKIGNDPNTNAIKFANEISKDANLTAKLLTLSNSIHYNHGTGNISVISRGIVLLGFNTIMNLALTLKLIESFQMSHPSIDMDKLLVKAYLSAEFARNLATAAGVKDSEETYTCALLHNLGEIISAYTLSERYLLLQEDIRFNPYTNLTTLEKKHIGTSLENLGRCLAEDWGFPPSIINAMETTSPTKLEQAINSDKLNASFATLASTITEYLLTGTTNYGEMNFKQLMTVTSKVAGIDYETTVEALISSFKISCDHATECGLKPSKLGPSIKSTDDTLRDHFARKLSNLTGNTSLKINFPIDNNLHQDSETKTVNNSQNQLDAIHEITTMIGSQISLQNIFKKVLVSICETCDFERCALILINKEHSHYRSRMEYGNRSDLLKHYFDHPVSTSDDIFSKMLMDGSELIIENVLDPGWSQYIKPDFYKRTATDTFVIASLRNNDRPIGFFYADRFMSDDKINTEHYRSFMQFVTQARLAIQISKT